MRDLASLFKALSDETRLEILAFLSLHGELCVCDLQVLLGATQSRTSRHLRYLLNSGLLSSRRDSAWVYYRIADALDTQRREVVRTVRDVLDPKQTAELQGRIDAWFARKDDESLVCQSP